MHTTHLLTVSHSISGMGGSLQSPWMQTPRSRPSRLRQMPQRQNPWRQTILGGRLTCSCDLWHMLGSSPPTPSRGQTNTYENITLLQTSLAGGKNDKSLLPHILITWDSAATSFSDFAVSFHHLGSHGESNMMFNVSYFKPKTKLITVLITLPEWNDI